MKAVSVFHMEETILISCAGLKGDCTQAVLGRNLE